MTVKAKKKTFDDRGAEYADSSLLRQRVKVGKTLACVIDGRYGTYRTRATLTPTRIKDADCSCPSEYWPCKHAAALVVTYRKSPQSFVDTDKLLAYLKEKPVKELVALIREMVAAAPASLRALGVEGFDDDDEERYD